ncbi:MULTISPECIES: NUDIX domain-containing protein [Streptomyces]|uniref:NUDIX domain-containing protein n=1 Tax=Streptomyces tsukubensis (strain DSM 42081 / NBRC 108919 / NRRL 18488 / 9993) TaxID=1114943 RepID=I2NA51_STRT9|nr:MULTISPECIES: NUDIX domain-containing protein [Streptomyces]AZK97709.1 NUDIX hydrolase [Streptomyces tsukubensis]EIF93898.1 NUDIX hydrolase [Streptomyces tsukubensis NRRL18488]MYS64332.1 NUDIX domain-containing protein [Streptomyces sp. SID5473]QKM66356.1 NUDIX domain-containing protein [Streptomyces tsukubensis NRRL18488]TAI45557.1 NUDIX domain-containing protein [Streptomyces tsukubensis]
MAEQVRSRISAYAIATAGEQLLLTRLSEASPVFLPGLWHLPGGGIDPGEQPGETLAREMWEETGLELASARLVDARSYTAHRLGVHWHLVALFYRVELKSGTLKVIETGGSTAEVRWLPLPDLVDAVLSPAAIDALGMIGRR